MPEKGDVRPGVDHLWLDHVVETVRADRLAAAAAMVFAEHTSSRFKFPEAVSPATARAIEALDPLGRRRVDLVLVSEAARRPLGGAVLVVGVDDAAATVRNQRGMQRRVALNVLRTDRYSGGLLTMESLSVASNAWLHVVTEGSPLSAHLPFIAMAILLCDELGARAIELRSGLLESDPALARRLTELCNAVGLALLAA